MPRNEKNAALIERVFPGWPCVGPNLTDDDVYVKLRYSELFKLLDAAREEGKPDGA